jgi:para-nitrobenzyl esterase
MQTNPDPQLWGEAALSSLPWAPAVDGDLLPQAPIDAIRAGAAADVDVIVGSNLDETRTFLLPGGFLQAITDQAMSKHIEACHRRTAIWGLSKDTS